MERRNRSTILALRAAKLALLLCIASVAASGINDADDWAPCRATPSKYETSIFSKRYRLDEPKSLAAFISRLDSELERAKREQKLGEEHQKDPLNHKLPGNFIDKAMRHAMQEARECAVELSSAGDQDRDRLLRELWVIAGAIRATSLRVLPRDMNISEAIWMQGSLTHPPVGVGKGGRAVNLAEIGPDPAKIDPIVPSSYWHKWEDISSLDLYNGFGRKELPNFDDVVCTYDRSKQSRGTHGGYDVKCKKYGKVKLKFGEVFSQPVAHRLFWALGFNVPPVDSARTVKVKWDKRIVTEYNTRIDETVTVSAFGLLPITRDHLQHNLDPLEPVAEIVMLDEQGKEITLRPNPGWDGFKKDLYKNPKGKPYLVKDNINEAFSGRIKYLVYHNVNIRMKDEDIGEDDAIYLGNWDLDGDDNPGMRENRGFAFASAWINQFDTPADNNKLYMVKRDGKRLFKHYYTDLGGSFGPANDSRRMFPEQPNSFPWTFTRSPKGGTTEIPIDGSFHPILRCAAFTDADVYDARWTCRYLSQITSNQILQALVASGMPSAEVRLFYNKLASRRNQAFADLGLAYPPLKLLDESKAFDYDPQKDGPIRVTTVDHRTVEAADADMIVLRGRLYSRNQVVSGSAARDVDKANK